MFKLGSLAAGLAVVLAAAAGTVGLSGCSSDYDGYGWSQPATEPQPMPANGSLSDEQKEKLLDRVTEMVRERAFASGVNFDKWPDHLKKHQASLDRATNMTQFSTAVNRALNEFGISHIDFMTPRAAQMQHAPTFGGIGITRDQQQTEAGIKIIEVREGGPAAKAGLRVGDVIVEVDGKKYAYDAIRGEVGSEVVLKVLRADSGKVEEFKIKRALLNQAQPPRLIKVTDEAAVVRLDSFTEGYDQDVVKKVMTKAADYPYLVIDLRSNGGGSVTNFINFLSTLLPKGTDVGTFISRDMVERYQRSLEQDGEAREENPDPVKIAAWSPRKVQIKKNMVTPYPGKVAVLINRGSASASEIVAAAMRELRDAPLVGDRSAGAVLMSQYVKMDDGFEMKVPTSDYVTIKGLRIEGSPLQPDVKIGGARRSISSSYAEDKAVLAAIDALRAMSGEHAEEGVKAAEGDGK